MLQKWKQYSKIRKEEEELENMEEKWFNENWIKKIYYGD